MQSYKVLYNTTYGGFHIPKEICDQFEKKYGEKLRSYTMLRSDERLIEMVEATDWFEKSDLAIKEVPVGCEYDIEEYDGMETVSWSLPESTIIDDLRKLLIGETTDEDVHPLTKKFLEFGGKFRDFEYHFRKKFKEQF